MKRTTSFLVYVLLPIFWALLLGAGLLFYTLNRDPAELAKTLAARLSLPEYGLSLSAERATLSLFPRPAADVAGLVVRTPGATLFVEQGTLYPDLQALLHGSVRVIGLKLHSPSLLLEKTDDSGQLGFPALPQQLAGMTLTLDNGSITALSANGDKTSRPVWRVSGLSGTGSLPDDEVPGGLSLDAQRLEWFGDKPPKKEGELTPVHVVDNAALRLSELRYTLPDSGAAPHLSGRIECSGPLPMEKQAPRLVLDTTVNMTPERIALDGTLALDGTVSLLRQALPLKMHLPFTTETTFAALSAGTPPPLTFKNAALTLEKDSVAFDGTLTPPHDTTPPRLQGSLTVKQLSLPRWFGFGRSLPPGVQAALDHLQGKLDFELTSHRLAVTAATASTLGVVFKGTGGVEDFGKPVIALNLSAKNVPLDKLFPAPQKPKISAPRYRQPPLLGGADDPTPAPGYDIQLAADKATLWKWAGNALSVRISPEQKQNTPSGRTQTEEAHVAIVCGSLYGGSARADIVSTTPLSLTIAANTVNADALLTPLAGRSFLKGSLTGTAALTASADSPDAFFSSLKGKTDVRIEQGEWLRSPSEKQPFTKLHLTFQGASVKRQGTAPSYAFSGNWQGELATADGQGAVSLTGALCVPADGPFQLLAEDAAVSGKGSFKGYTGQGKGLLSLSTQANTVAFKHFSGHLASGTAAVSVSGSLNGTKLNAAPGWEGDLSLSTGDLRALLRHVDVALPELPPAALRKASATTKLTLHDANLQLSSLEGLVDDTTFSGQLERTKASPPHWTARLNIGTLRLSDYLPPSSGQAHSKTPWKTDWLKSCDVDAKLELKKLVIARIAHENMSVPLNLKNGVLIADPVRGRVAGGSMGAGLRLEATQGGLLSRLRYTLNAVNVLTLCRERGETQGLSGTGTLDADVSGLVRSGADIPAALNGKLAFSVKNGSLDAQHPGPLNRFTLLSATGTLSKGILSTRDLTLSGGLSVRGQGSINLVSKTLDYLMTVTGPGLPEIPVRYTGSLSAPRRSVNATGFLENALSSIGNGVLTLLDSVVSTPLRLLAP